MSGVRARFSAAIGVAAIAAARASSRPSGEIVVDPRSRGATESTGDGGNHRRWFVARWTLTGLGALVWVGVLVNMIPEAWDAHAYFLGAYGGTWGQYDAYVYSPAFSQLVEPLRWLGWDGFRMAWRAIETGTLVAVTGPLSGLWAFVFPVSLEIKAGNIHLLLAGAIAIGFRYPAAWSFVLLTKVTPGIGLLWFAVRREWRELGIALGVTVAIATASFIIDPGAWGAWMTALTVASTTPDPFHLVADVPLLIRLPLAGLLVVAGASSNRRWVMPIAVVLSLPAMWTTSLSVLVAVPVLWWNGRRTRGTTSSG